MNIDETTNKIYERLAENESKLLESFKSNSDLDTRSLNTSLFAILFILLNLSNNYNNDIDILGFKITYDNIFYVNLVIFLIMIYWSMELFYSSSIASKLVSLRLSNIKLNIHSISKEFIEATVNYINQSYEIANIRNNIFNDYQNKLSEAYEKKRNLSIDDYFESEDLDKINETIKSITEEYNNSIKKNGIIDFDENTKNIVYRIINGTFNIPEKRVAIAVIHMEHAVLVFKIKLLFSLIIPLIIVIFSILKYICNYFK